MLLDAIVATHVVVGIDWEANYTVAAEYSLDEKETEVGGSLDGQVEMFLTNIKAEADVK